MTKIIHFFDIIIKVTITESDVCNCQIFNNSTVINITYAKKIIYYKRIPSSMESMITCYAYNRHWKTTSPFWSFSKFYFVMNVIWVVTCYYITCFDIKENFRCLLYVQHVNIIHTLFWFLSFFNSCAQLELTLSEFEKHILKVCKAPLPIICN